MTKAFYDNVPVDRVLLVDVPGSGCDQGEGWYPGATDVTVKPGPRLDEKVVREWLQGLDVVYAAETTYDWRMPRWAKQLGVKIVVHGMPEYFRHGMPGMEELFYPDAWWWPTSYRLDKLPPGPVIPVPMPDHEATGLDPFEGPLHIYHIAGKRAAYDRNGTDTFIESLRALDKNIVVTIRGLEGSLPNFGIPRGLTVNIDNVGPADRWDMHRGQHLLVLPRRYAGLSLPALEASSRGIAVMMPDASPNRELASILGSPLQGRPLRFPCGRLETTGMHFFTLAQEINTLNKDRERLAAAMKQSYEMTPRWSTYRQVYLDELAKVAEP